MATLAQAVIALQAGREVEVCPHGSSMRPLIVSGAKVRLSPLETQPKCGDIVLARVRGCLYLHLVSALDGKRVQIANNRGHVNGWTTLERVYGRVSAIDNSPRG